MFKTMTSVLDPKKNPSSDEINKIPSYLFCRWLSGHPHTILAANMINLNHSIPIENQYQMIRSAFAGKIKYIPYPKNVTQDSLKQIQYLCEHFKISEEKAHEYLDLIDKKELQDIVQMYDEYYTRNKR
ncbi:putative clamp loader subunit [Vibrio phage Va1]|nr:putative clamp loader subunit [Vibrio phage Va1]